MAQEEIIADAWRDFSQETQIHASFRVSGEPGRAMVLFGPSGCGKSTSLRLLAGLERVDRGSIRAGDVLWADAQRGESLPVRARQVGFLTQDAALFPHLNVAENVAYGLRQITLSERRRRVHEMLDLVGLAGLHDMRPQQLSGGEAQRVALARTLVRRPRWIFLDEPLSGLDGTIRASLRRDLRNLLRAWEIPSVWVTHDRGELDEVADDMVVMQAGRVLQAGLVRTVMANPASLSAARALGFENRHALMALGGGAWQKEAGDATHLAFRAEDAMLRARDGADAGQSFLFPGVFQSHQREGHVVRVRVQSGGTILEIVISCQYFEAVASRLGEDVEVSVPVHCCRFLR
jgi:ABC-type sulfate/molybdate transport systems ATPase subunit